MASQIVQSVYPPLYNGMQLSFCNLQLGIVGKFFPFLTELEYSDTNEVVEGRGISPYNMGTTIGEYKASGSLTIQKLYEEEFDAIIASQSPDGKSLYDAIFDITAQYQLRVPPSQPQPAVQKDELKGCRITGKSDTMSTGNGVLVVKHSLHVGLIIRNGRLPIAGLPQ